MKRALPALLVAVLSSSGSPTWAKPDAPSVADDAKARDLFKQGDSAYAEGRYEDALAAFEEAHRLSKRPRLLFNIGNALERLGKLAEAADALEKYLPHAKPAERDVIQKRIQNLRKRSSPPPKVVLEEEKEPEPEERPAQKRSEEPPPQPKPPRPEREPVPADASSDGEATLGYVLIAAGGAAMGAGAVFGAMALAARKDIDASCKESGGQTLCDSSGKDAVDRDQRYSLFADLGLGLGLAAVGAGVYFLVSAPSDDKTRVVADVAVAPRGGAIRVRAAF